MRNYRCDVRACEKGELHETQSQCMTVGSPANEQTGKTYPMFILVTYTNVLCMDIRFLTYKLSIALILFSPLGRDTDGVNGWLLSLEEERLPECPSSVAHCRHIWLTRLTSACIQFETYYFLKDNQYEMSNDLKQIRMSVLVVTGL